MVLKLYWYSVGLLVWYWVFTVTMILFHIPSFKIDGNFSSRTTWDVAYKIFFNIIRCTFNLPLVENINFVHDAWKLYEPFPRSNRSDNNI